jgi:hypothetical protein
VSGQPFTEAQDAPVERRAFTPFRLAGLTLRNRIIKSATYEGMTPEGRAGEALARHHAELAAGGVGLTTVAYAAVASAGRTFSHQLLMDEDQVARLRPLTEQVHRHGGAASLQLTHCGGFTKYRAPGEAAAAGPSRAFNTYGALSGLVWTRAMNEADIAVVAIYRCRRFRPARHRQSSCTSATATSQPVSLARDQPPNRCLGRIVRQPPAAPDRRDPGGARAGRR